MPSIETVLIFVFSVLAISFVGLLPCLLLVAAQHLLRLVKHASPSCEYKIQLLPAGKRVKTHCAAFSIND
jgi:hypothetical protein